MEYEPAMSGQYRRKSRLISGQKPVRRRNQPAENKASRKKVDLIQLHRQVVGIGKRHKTLRLVWIKIPLFVIAIPGFFVIGYWIAALSVSVTIKAIIAFPVAILGIILSYITASAFR